MLRTLIGLTLQWNNNVKITLLAAMGVLLVATVVLLIRELMGRK